MRLYRHFRDLPPGCRGAVAALGNFDGVHRGHRALVAEAARLARSGGRPLGVLTFEPHPREVFRPDDPPFRLTPLRAKIAAMEALAPDYLFVQRFTPAFSRLSAEAFVADMLAAGLAVSGVVVGADFRFGRGRTGDLAALDQLGRQHGLTVTAMAEVADEAGPVSSTRVREALSAGDPETAAALLGRPWEITGHVAHGDKRGRTLNYPTANVPLGRHHRPAYGVYAVRCGVGDRPDRWHDGVASLGVRPMWRLAEPLLEAHLFDFAGDLYGQRLRVQLCHYLRPEARFESLDALLAQMGRDSAEARARLAAQAPPLPVP